MVSLCCNNLKQQGADCPHQLRFSRLLWGRPSTARTVIQLHTVAQTNCFLLRRNLNDVPLLNISVQRGSQLTSARVLHRSSFGNLNPPPPAKKKKYQNCSIPHLSPFTSSKAWQRYSRSLWLGWWCPQFGILHLTNWLSDIGSSLPMSVPVYFYNTTFLQDSRWVPTGTQLGAGL